MCAANSDTIAHRVYARVTWRIIPFLFFLYVLAYLDRINVAFAGIHMTGDLHFSDAVFGLGEGIFFVGYFLFEVPSNLVMERVGARRWMARIMITWGIISAVMATVHTSTSFYALRFLLGAAEAGFFPGMILYLTWWFPAEERARAVSRFMLAVPTAGIVGGLICGNLLGMNGLLGLHGWQWLFILEGVPSVVMGIVILFYLTDRPEQAKWLAPHEREWLSQRMARDRDRQGGHGHMSLREGLLNPSVLLLAAVYFGLVTGMYGVTMWLPKIVKGFSGLSDQWVGVLSILPHLGAALGMVLVGTRSDRSGERRRHVFGPACLAAAGIGGSAVAHVPALQLAFLTVAAFGLWGTVGPFWALPTAFLGGTAAAGGIALINSIGCLGGFVGPYAVGLARTLTGTFAGGLLVLAGFVAVGGALALMARSQPAAEEQAA